MLKIDIEQPIKIKLNTNTTLTNTLSSWGNNEITKLKHHTTTKYKPSFELFKSRFANELSDVNDDVIRYLNNTMNLNIKNNEIEDSLYFFIYQNSSV